MSTTFLFVGTSIVNVRVGLQHENLRVMSAASHLTQEGCQYLLASAAYHGIDLHLIGYKDRCAPGHTPPAFWDTDNLTEYCLKM